MKALILNSGMGKRMGSLTSEHPKCMSEIGQGETIFSRQVRMLVAQGITEIVVTTGLFDTVLREYAESLQSGAQFTFVRNPLYDQTNYIYSMNLAAAQVQDDVILMHGDLVFSRKVLECVLSSKQSCMAVSSTLPLPEKDFKTVLEQGRIARVGIEFFENAVAAQPLYHLKKADWLRWMKEISDFCSEGKTNCYAENALNAISDECSIAPLDVKDALCGEIDTPEDLVVMKEKLNRECE